MRAPRRTTRGRGGGFGRPGGLGGGLQPGRAAAALAALLTLGSLAAVWSQTAAAWLLASRSTFADLRLTALLGNTLVAAPSGFLGFAIFVAIGVFLFLDRVRTLWYTQRNALIGWSLGVLAALFLIDRFVLRGLGWGWASGVLVLLWFGTAVERRWGPRRTLVFAFWIVVPTNAVVAALLTWAPWTVTALTNAARAAPTHGVFALSDALLAAWCLMHGSARLAILNIEARKLVWVLVALGVLDLLFTSRLVGIVRLLAVALTWLLLTGHYRPRVLIDRLRLWRIDRRLAKRRGRFEVIDGGRNLHRAEVTP